LNWVKYSFFLFQLSLLPLLININPAAAETVVGDRSQRTANNSVRDVSPRQEVSTSATDLLAQAPITRVTGVEVNQTDKGLEVILKTAAGGQRLVPLILPEGNKLVIEILDANLAFGIRNGVTKTNPAPGIKTVNLAKVDESSIRLTITGESKTPRAEIVPSRQNLVLNVTPEGRTAQIQPDEEIEIIATGEAEDDDDYNVPDTTTATKTDTPLRDIPANIQIVPQQVLKDQGVIRIEEALRNVSGVNLTSTFGGRAADFTSRGFNASIFRDGIPESSGSFANRRLGEETAEIDRIEVLKGPASVLFGQSFPGGLINLVTKKPLSNPYYAIEFTAGSYSFYRTTLDFSAPLTSNGSLAYRLNVAYENADSFRDKIENERFLIAPVLSWKLGSQTTLAFKGSYGTEDRPIDRGLLAVGDSVADVPFDTNYQPGNRPVELEEKRGAITLEHKFNPNLSLRSTFQVAASQELRSVVVQPFLLLEDNRTIELDYSTFDENYEAYVFQTDLLGKLSTGSVKHTTLLGFELSRGTIRSSNLAFASEPIFIDLFSPVDSIDLPPLIPDENDFFSKTDTLGIYLQDQIAFTDNLKLVLGSRFDTFESRERTGSDPEQTSSDSAFSPRVGLVYQPSKTISLYANYSRAFIPQSGRSLEDQPFEPEKSTQYETGIKADLLDGGLSATLAAYEITKSNVLTADPENIDFSIQVGEQRSRGIEFDIAGEILPGWNLIASYAYTDAQITKDNTFEEGNRLNSVPYNTASLWTTYEIQSGSLQGLGFGTGIFFVDERTGDLDNSFTVPSYARVDSSLYYTRGKFKTALNFKNLFDVDYFESAQNRESNAPGAPFTVLGSVSVEF